MQLQHHHVPNPQRTIHHLQQQLFSSQQQSISLKQQLHTMTQQRNQYKEILKNDPLYHIFSTEENLPANDGVHSFTAYDQQQKRLVLYRQRLESYEMRFSVLQNRVREKEEVLKVKERQILQLIESEIDMKRANYLLKQEVNVLSKGNSELKKIINEYSSKTVDIAKQYQHLRRQLSQKSHKQMQFITDLSHQLSYLTNNYTKVNKIVEHYNQKESITDIASSQRVKQMSQRVRQQSEIMEEMGRELDLRNEEIAKLLSLQVEVTPGYSADQHTIMEMIKSTQLREERYKKLLMRYKEMLQTLQTSNKQKQHLQQQYITLQKQYDSIKNLKEQNTALLQQYQKYKQSYQIARQQLQQSDQNTIVILQENQAFHQMMFSQFGQKVYLSKIQEEVKKYQQRKREREGRELWANVEELVNVNRKLRERVMRGR